MVPDYFENLELSSMASDLVGKPQNQSDQIDKTVPILPTDVVSGISGINRRGSRDQRTLEISEPELTEISLPPSVKMDPAVGWLVCVDGIDKGRSFRLVKGNNPIGRPGKDNKYSISLTDQAISRKGAVAVIVYNEKSNQFFITTGDLTTNINPYLNDEILLSPKLLKPRSVLEIASDILIFVPFCSEKFVWRFGTENEKPKNEVPDNSRGDSKMVRCERGHLYNSAEHDTCPQCAAEEENDPDGKTKIYY